MTFRDWMWILFSIPTEWMVREQEMGRQLMEQQKAMMRSREVSDES